jgi:hypothetical protein
LENRGVEIVAIVSVFVEVWHTQESLFHFSVRIKGESRSQSYKLIRFICIHLFWYQFITVIFRNKGLKNGNKICMAESLCDNTVLKKHISPVLLTKAKQDALKRILRRKGKGWQSYPFLACNRCVCC